MIMFVEVEIVPETAFPFLFACAVDFSDDFTYLIYPVSRTLLGKHFFLLIASTKIRIHKKKTGNIRHAPIALSPSLCF